jgi:hypothetical protein
VRQHPDADDVVLGAARTGELGVLLVVEEAEVQRDQGQDDARQQQDVNGVQAGDHLAGAGEFDTEHQRVHPGADHRDGQRNA